MAVPATAHIKTLKPRLEMPREDLGCADSLPFWERSEVKDRKSSFSIEVAILIPGQQQQLSPVPHSCPVAEAVKPWLFIPSNEFLLTLQRNAETGSPACLIVVATSCTFSASTAQSNLPFSGSLHLTPSDNDGRAVPKLKGCSYSFHVAQLSSHLLNLYCPCCRGCGLYSSKSATIQHVSWSWLGHRYLELPLLFFTAISKSSGDMTV